MEYHTLNIPGLVILEPRVFEDPRGFFMETFRQRDFERHCGAFSLVQDNHSRSSKGTLRGLHYQLEHPQGKLVRVTRGEVFDVAVDMRRSSPTFGQWAGVTLSARNRRQLWVPPGFAHGFYVTSEEAELQYKCTDYYAPGDEYAVRWDDPKLNIQWPVASGVAPLLSPKDAAAPCWSEISAFYE